MDADRIKRRPDLCWCRRSAATWTMPTVWKGLEVSGDDDFPNEFGVDASGEDTPTVKFINKALVDAIRSLTSILSPMKPNIGCVFASMNRRLPRKCR